MAAESAMDLRSSLALYARGREAWNAWAETMIEQRRALVATGEWAWALDSRADAYPTNEATRRWWNDAVAQFSYHEFVEPVDFRGFLFPGAGAFVSAKLPQDACFCEVRFCDGACFNFAEFGGAADFTDAEFVSHGHFMNAKFRSELRFDRCRFVAGKFEPTLDGSIDFANATFAMPVSFREVWCGHTNFADAEFAQTVSFAGAAFWSVFFIARAKFGGEVLLQDAWFLADVDWSDATLAIPPTR
jgi:hypothetical protein